jgi:SAM-dependent methyltransferase
MKNRTDLLNHLAEKYHLKRYLEIGLQNAAQNFDKIICEYKVSVDPDPKACATFKATSDQFFSIILDDDGNAIYDFGYSSIFRTGKNSIKTDFDLVFLDGLHTAEQVRKDFENALKVLSPNGFIVLHDCNPEKEEHTIVPRPTVTGHWNGDCYKFIVDELHLYYKKYCTVDIDNGCGVWMNSGADILKDGHYPPNNWMSFNANRKDLLNLISWDEFL